MAWLTAAAVPSSALGREADRSPHPRNGDHLDRPSDFSTSQRKKSKRQGCTRQEASHEIKWAKGQGGRNKAENEPKRLRPRQAELQEPSAKIPPLNDPPIVLISYSHKDEALKKELITHFSPLKRKGLLACWHDCEIGAGFDWKQEIDAWLEDATLIVLLISCDFIASDYCYEIEMRRALERHEAGECRVIPIFLRACDWKGAPFGSLQGLPHDAIPVVSRHWASRDDAWLQVVRGIRTAIKNWRAAAIPPCP